MTRRWQYIAASAAVRFFGVGLAAMSVAIADPSETTDAGHTHLPDAMAERMMACTACHGDTGRATADGYYPRIAGKPAGYLYQQLLNFRDGRRQYAPMTLLLDHLPNAYLQDIGRYFANQHPPYPPPERHNLSAAQRDLARQLIFDGDPARELPACAACHGADLAGREPAMPGLLGLSRDYLSAQLGSWQNNTRKAMAPDCMAEVARQLQPAELAAVAGWLASQPVPPDYRPAAASTEPLPLSCHQPVAEGAPR